MPLLLNYVFFLFQLYPKEFFNSFFCFYSLRIFHSLFLKPYVLCRQKLCAFNFNLLQHHSCTFFLCSLYTELSCTLHMHINACSHTIPQHVHYLLLSVLINNVHGAVCCTITCHTFIISSLSCQKIITVPYSIFRIVNSIHNEH